MQVDKGAAARFIKAALADDEDQEGKLSRYLYMFGQLMDNLENAGVKRKVPNDEEEESSRVEAVQNNKQQNKKRSRMDPFAGIRS